jgi:aspartyl-tRNA(Asn)/glutamyl-tRNA(Gln) amidotransferase subunit B
VKYCFNVKIGIECHIQITSNSKAFSSSRNKNKYTNNTLINETDLGFPGTLPTINKSVLDSALTLSYTLNSDINKCTTFMRKHYFYPDLPKGYQITQLLSPISEWGAIYTTNLEGRINKVNIDRIQIEEDTGKSFYNNGSKYINYNRAGIPLLELVTYPNIKTSSEVIQSVRTIQETIKRIGISSASMDEGALRVDINISVQDKFKKSRSNRVEIKNLNSVAYIKNVVEYEITRQILLQKKFLEISQETRSWNDKLKQTKVLRFKEKSDDYKLMVEPNLPNLQITQKLISKATNSIIPDKNLIFKIFTHNIKLINANLNNKYIIFYILKTIKIYNNPSLVVKWITNNVLGFFNLPVDSDFKRFFISPNDLSKIIKLSDKKFINNKSSKKMYKQILLLEKNTRNINFFHITNKKVKLSLIDKIIGSYIDKYTIEVKKLQNGNQRVIDFFVGKISQDIRGSIKLNVIKKLVIKKIFKY